MLLPGGQRYALFTTFDYHTVSIIRVDRFARCGEESSDPPLIQLGTAELDFILGGDHKRRAVGAS